LLDGVAACAIFVELVEHLSSQFHLAGAEFGFRAIGAAANVGLLGGARLLAVVARELNGGG
jgi:hypothetical protein